MDKLVDIHKDGKKFLKAGPFHDALLEIEKACKDLCTDMVIKINQRKSQKKNPAVANDVRNKVRTIQKHTVRMVQAYLIDAVDKKKNDNYGQEFLYSNSSKAYKINFNELRQKTRGGWKH